MVRGIVEQFVQGNPDTCSEGQSSGKGDVTSSLVVSSGWRGWVCPAELKAESNGLGLSSPEPHLFFFPQILALLHEIIGTYLSAFPCCPLPKKTTFIHSFTVFFYHSFIEHLLCARNGDRHKEACAKVMG
jgi:hypothetical protein